ncbi:MAG TPA: ABC transporter permease [Nitrospira sp.]
MFRQLRYNIARTGFTVLAVAAVVAVILILEGFLAGLYHQLRTAVEKRGGDLIVAQSGVSSFIAARSILPQQARLDVEQIEGVEEAHPLTGLSAIYVSDGRRTPIFILVYDTAGGPTMIAEGGPIAGDREIVIDRAIATKYALSPGDPITISDFEFKISGIAENSSSFLTPFAFITYDDLIDFYFESDIAADIATFPLLSFLLVQTTPDVDRREVAARIEERLDTADVFLPEELATSDENLGRELMGPILNLLLVVSYGIGVLVVGMFMFSAIQGRLRSLGVMKALGFGPRALGGAMLLEALVLTVLGLPVGIVLAYLVAEVIQVNAPVYVILATEAPALVRTAVACLLFSALGAVLPLRTILRIDPAVAFRS